MGEEHSHLTKYNLAHIWNYTEWEGCTLGYLYSLDYKELNSKHRITFLEVFIPGLTVFAFKPHPYLQLHDKEGEEERV